MTKLPLYPHHHAWGATFEEHCGWEIPAHFGDVKREVFALREGVGMMDLSWRGKIDLIGSGRVKFLHSKVTNDIQNLAPGQGCPAVMCNVKGHMLSVLRVFAHSDRLRMDVPPDLRKKTFDLLENAIIFDPVEVLDRSEDFVILSIEGPKSRNFLSECLGISDLPLTPFAHRAVTVSNFLLQITLGGETGEEAFNLWIPVDQALKAAEWIWAQGQAVQLQPIGYHAYNMLRIEAGTPWYGFDMGEDTIPLEVGLKSAISFTKGCYLGQEVIARIDARGHVNWTLARLLLDREVSPGDLVYSDEKEIGRITSATNSFTLGQPIALAFLRKAKSEPGTPVTVKSLSGEVFGRVGS